MVAGRPEPPLTAFDGFGKERFFHRRETSIDPINLVRIDIDTKNVKSPFSQGGGDTRTKFSQPEHRDFLKRFHFRKKAKLKEAVIGYKSILKNCMVPVSVLQEVRTRWVQNHG
jgi:hypothetical protein